MGKKKKLKEIEKEKFIESTITKYVDGRIARQGSVLKPDTESEQEAKKRKRDERKAILRGDLVVGNGAKTIFNLQFEKALQETRKRKGKKEGADTTNTQTSSRANQRRQEITKHLQENPNPDTKGYSLAWHLIIILKLTVSERTVNDDLKKINLEKR